MDLENYISSGIIESYVMGTAGEQEVLEFEALLSRNPALRDAMHAFEIQLELYAKRNAVPPPPHIRNSLVQRITRERNMPVREPISKRPEEEVFIPVTSSGNQIRVHKYWRYAFIAVFILSKIFLVAALYYYFSYKDAERQIQRLEQPVERRIIP